MLYLFIALLVITLIAGYIYYRLGVIINLHNDLVDDYNELRVASKSLLLQNDELKKIIDFDLVNKYNKIVDENRVLRSTKKIMEALENLKEEN